MANGRSWMTEPHLLFIKELRLWILKVPSLDGSGELLCLEKEEVNGQWSSCTQTTQQTGASMYIFLNAMV